MDAELKSVLDRADELLHDLLQEYDKCLGSQNVTFRAQNLFHEVLLKLRSALDMTMMRIWEKHAAPQLTDTERGKAAKQVYFPICDQLDDFNSALAKVRIQHIEQVRKELHDSILKAQPFSTERSDLARLRDWSNLGKHVRLVRHECEARPAIRVTAPGGTMLYTHGVKFHGQHIMGAPIDPATHQIIPTPDVKIEQVTWVSFAVEECGTDPIIFCSTLCQNTRKFLETLLERM